MPKLHDTERELQAHEHGETLAELWNQVPGAALASLSDQAEAGESPLDPVIFAGLVSP